MRAEDSGNVIILRGAGALQRAASWSDVSGRTTFRLDLDSESFLAWGAMRRLLAMTSDVVGEAAIRAAMAPVRGPLAVCLPALAADLDARERAERSESSGVARFPFSGPIFHDPLADAWAELLAEIHRERGVCVVLPDSALMDPESWEVFPRLLRRLPTARVVVADVAAPTTPTGVQGRVAQIAHWQVTRLEALRSAQVRVIACDEPDATHPPPPRRTLEASPLDSDEDCAAVRLSRGPLSDPTDLPRVVAAIHRAFDAQGFAAVAILAEPLLAGGASFPGRSEIELLTGIARHALGLVDPRLPPEDAWMQDIEPRYRAAFPGLVMALDRCHANYHLSIFAGGRRDRESALLHAQEALREARAVVAQRRPLAEAYALNVLALAHFRNDDKVSALSTSEEALRAFDGAIAAGASPALELKIGRFKVLNNMARLMSGSGREAESRRLFAASQEALAEIPQKRPFFTWFTHLIFLDRLVLGAQDAERSADAALGAWDENTAATHANFAGFLRYMAGDARRALANFALAHDTWSILGAVASDILGLRVNCALSAMHAGLLDEASRWMERAQELIGEVDPSLSEDAALVCAALDARRGDMAVARRTVARVEAALAEEVDVAIGVRRRRGLGEAYLELGDRPRASEQFRAAHALMIHAGYDEFRPDEVFGILAAKLHAGDEDDTVALSEVVRLGPVALDEINAWWDLPRVMRALARRGATSLHMRAERANVLALCDLAAQRSDCMDSVATVRAAFCADAIQAAAQ